MKLWQWGVLISLFLILLFTSSAIGDTFSSSTFGGEIVVSYNGEPSIDESSASPANGTIGVSLPPTLSINVSDAEGDNTVVYFYDNSDDSLIGTDTCGAANRTATTTWNGLEYATLYSWYIIVEECPHRGTLNSNTSIVFNLTTRSVTQFSEKATFGGNLEISALGTTEWDIWNNGYDYFCWKGDNGTLSDVASVIDGFNESIEYVAVWKDTVWNDSNWCWIKYYGDGNGTNANVYQLDVIYVYLLNGAGKQTISMTATTPPTCARTVPLNDFGDNVNRGYNYTCYCCDISGTDVSTVAGNIPLQTGEVLSWWDNSTQEWRGWIEGISHTDYDYTVNVTCPIFETKVHTDVSWVITCP